MSSRKRRSPRLPKSVEVRVAGRGEAGEVIVESTETLDISKHGASLVTRNRFPVGSPIALRRPGAKPMRARVVSAKPGTSDSTMHLGVEFVGEEGNWDLEFPADWADYFNRDQDPANIINTEARKQLRLEDGALEAVLRKAEALRNQAETMLAEYAAQVDGARRQNTSVLAAQVEEFRAWKGLLSGETGAQVESAKESVNAEIERGRVRLERETAELSTRIKKLSEECDAGLKASEAAFHKIRVEEAQKNVQLVAKIASQLEAQRKTMKILDDQAAAWRGRTNENLAAFDRDVKAMMQKASGEMQTSSAAAISEFRQKLPALGQELEKHFASFLAQQKAAASAWLEEAATNMRAGTAKLEQEHRAALEHTGKLSLEDFGHRLDARLEDFRKSGDALAAPLDARANRVRELLTEMAAEADQAVAKARADLAAVVEKSGANLRDLTAQKTADIAAAEAASRKKLEAAGESMLHTAHEATKRVDQSALDLQAKGSALHQQASSNRKELEAQFAGLLTMYDNRKKALDNLLETLETGRTAVRDGLELLRVNGEEQRARLDRYTADQMSALTAHTSGMEQRLDAAITRMEADLHERAGDALEASHQGFAERLEGVSAEHHGKFREGLEKQTADAAARIPGLLQQLDRCLAEHSSTLAAELAAHQKGMAETRTAIEEQGRASAEILDRKHAETQEALTQAKAATLSQFEDHHAAAATTINDLLKSIEAHQAATSRQHAEIEKSVQKWGRDTHADFTKLSMRLEEKRATLESFYTFAEQTKASWVKNMGLIERRIEDARTAIAGMEKQAGGNMEKQAGSLAEQLEVRLRRALETAQHELNAVSEAAESVFRARLTDHSQQTLKTVERQVEQNANGSAISLDRTMQNERKEHERQIADLGRRFEESLREQLDGFREASMNALNEMRVEMKKTASAMLDQVKESREELARDLPGQLTAAEETFRRNLERIQQRTLESASEEMRSKAAQWKARGELEMASGGG